MCTVWTWDELVEAVQFNQSHSAKTGKFLYMSPPSVLEIPGIPVTGTPSIKLISFLTGTPSISKIWNKFIND